MRFFTAATGDLYNSTMPSNYARYLYRRWNADRQIRGAVLWREYMSQYGADTPITIDVVRKLLREFRSENFSSVSSQVDLLVSSADDHQLPEANDILHPPKKPHLDGSSADDDDHYHHDAEGMEVEDKKEESVDDEIEKEVNDNEDDDEEDDDDDDDENENEDDEDEDDQKGVEENEDNENRNEEYEEEGGVEKRIETENNGYGDEDDLHDEEDNDINDKISDLGDVPSARKSLVAALPSETKRAFVLYQFMSKLCFLVYSNC